MINNFAKNISVKTRIKIFFVLLFAFAFLINFITFANLHRIRTYTQQLKSKVLYYQQSFDHIRHTLSDIVINSYIYSEQNIPYLDFYNFVNTNLNNIWAKLNEYEPEIDTYEEYIIIQKLQSSLKMFQNIALEYLNAYKLHDVDKYKSLAVKLDNSYQQVNSLLRDFEDYLHQKISKYYEYLSDETLRIRNTLIIVDFIMLLAIILFYSIFFSEFGYYFYKVKDVLSKISKGIIPDEPLPESESELGQLARDINEFIDSRKKIFEFIEKLKQEKYSEATIKIKSAKDIVAIALTELADQLNKAKEEQRKRMEEDKHRRWITEGLNMFSEIMRSTSHDLQLLGDAVIKNLVKYLDAALGGLYVVEDSDPNDVHLEMLSAFAYDRKKYYTKRIDFGEGLIGTAAVDMTVIYLTDLPEDYIEIESGLGDRKPNTLLIVPLKTDRGLQGVYEIAAFRTFEEYELEFAEQVAGSIAATIEAVKVNARTVQLLNETRQKSEELAKREKELTKLMQQIQKAQAEAEARAAEMSSILNAVNQAMLRVEFLPDGTVTTVNDSFLRTLKLSRQQVLDEHFRYILPKDVPNLDQIILKKLESLQIYTDTFHYNVGNKDIWLLVQFAPIVGPKNELIRILWLSLDITEQKEIEIKNAKLLEESIKKSEELLRAHQIVKRNEIELKSIMAGIDQTLLRAEYSVEGILLFANELHRKTFGYNYEEVLGKSIFIFIPEEEKEEFAKMWKEVAAGALKQIRVKRKTSTGEDVWLLNQYTPIRDEQGNITKILYLAVDITEQVEAEQRAKRLLEESRKIQKELEAKEVELRSILEGIDQAILRAEYTRDGILTFANELHRKTFGYNYEEVLGKSIFIFIPEEEKEEFAKLWAEVSAGNPKQIRVRRFTVTGEEVWLLNQYAPVRDPETGQVTKILYLAQDITEQVRAEQEAKKALEEAKKAQQQLIAKEHELSSILSGIDQAVLRAEYTKEGILTFANELHRKTLGYNYEEVLGKSIFIFIPENEKEEFSKLWADVVSGNLRQVRVRRYNAKGEEIWLLNTYVPVRNIETGEIEKVLYLAIDITEQVKAEQQIRKLLERAKRNEQQLLNFQEVLRKAEAERRAILAGIDRAILRAEYSPEGILLFANELHRKKLGYKYEEVLGKSIFYFIPERERDEFQKIWNRVRNGETLELRVKRYTAKGNEIWLLNQYTPVKDENGRIFKILYLAQDITEQVKAEQEAKKALVEALRREKELIKLQKEMESVQRKMKNIIDGVDKIVYRVLYNSEGYIIDYGENVAGVFGENELKNKHYKDLFRGKELEEFERAFKQALKGEMVKVEREIENYQGKHMWIISQFVPIFEDDKVENILVLNIDITEQKMKEQQINKLLQEALQRELDIQSLLKAIDSTMLRAEYSPSGELLDANTLHVKTMGYDLEQMKGKNILEFIPEDEKEEFKKLWEQVASGEAKQIVVKRQRKDTGQEIWLLNQYTPVFDEHGNVRKIIYMAMDITEQKKLETELTEALREVNYLRLGVDHVMLRAEYLPDGTLLDANALHQKTIGYKLDEYRGKNILEFVPEAEREEFQKIWQKVVSGELYTVAVYRQRKDTGEGIWLLNQYVPIKDDTGKVERIIYLATDITAQKELEIRLKYLMQGLDQALLRAEYLPDGTLLDSNALHQKILGYNIEELRGKNILEFIPQEEKEEFLKLWKRAASGERFSVVVSRERKDTGEQIWLLNNYIPVKDVYGRVERIIYLAIDITKEKQLETKLSHLLEGIDYILLRAEYTPEGILMDANELHQKVMGYDLEQMKGKSIWEFIPEKEKEEFKKIWDKVIKGEIYQVKVQRERKDTGELIWLLNQYIPVKDKYGKIIEIIYLAHDITQSELFRQKLEYLLKGVDRTLLRAEYTPDGVLMDANEMHQKVMGYDIEQMRGKTIWEFIPEEEKEEFKKIWDKVSKGEPYQVVVQRERKDTGETIWLLNQYIPVKDKYGKIVTVIYLAKDITEQKLIEENLNYILMGIDKILLRAEYTPDGKFLGSNELHQKIIGYREEDMIGKSIFEFIPEDEKEEFEQIWKRVQSGEVYQIVVRRQRKDTGETIWLLNQYVPIKDKYGTLKRIIYLALDISRQKELELRLQYMQQGIDSTMLRAEYDAQGRLLFANELHQKILGYKLIDYLGKSIFEFVPEEERDEFKKFWSEVLQGVPHQIVVRRERKDTGKDIWLLNQYIPVKDDNGKVVRVIYLAIDFTEQKKLEQRLYYLTLGVDQTLLRAEYLPDGTLVDANQLHQKVIGYNIEDLRGKNILEFVPEEEREEFEQIWNKVKSGEPYQVVVKRVRKDNGQTIWLLNQYMPVKDSDGNVERIIYLAVDITDYKKLYDEAVILKSEMEALLTAIDATMLKAEYSTDGKLLSANERHQKVMGYKLKDMLGKHITEFIPPEHRDEFYKVWDKVLKGEPQQIVVKRKNMTTGEDIWLINQYTPVFDEHGKVKKILYLAIDVTDRNFNPGQGKSGNDFEGLDKDINDWLDDLAKG